MSVKDPPSILVAQPGPQHITSRTLSHETALSTWQRSYMPREMPTIQSWLKATAQ